MNTPSPTESAGWILALATLVGAIGAFYATRNTARHVTVTDSVTTVNGVADRLQNRVNALEAELADRDKRWTERLDAEIRAREELAGRLHDTELRLEHLRGGLRVIVALAAQGAESECILAAAEEYLGGVT